jgi:hypothetical protein
MIASHLAAAAMNAALAVGLASSCAVALKIIVSPVCCDMVPDVVDLTEGDVRIAFGEYVQLSRERVGALQLAIHLANHVPLAVV